MAKMCWNAMGMIALIIGCIFVSEIRKSKIDPTKDLRVETPTHENVEVTEDPEWKEAPSQYLTLEVSQKRAAEALSVLIRENDILNLPWTTEEKDKALTALEEHLQLTKGTEHEKEAEEWLHRGRNVIAKAMDMVRHQRVTAAARSSKNRVFSLSIREAALLDPTKTFLAIEEFKRSAEKNQKPADVERARIWREQVEKDLENKREKYKETQIMVSEMDQSIIRARNGEFVDHDDYSFFTFMDANDSMQVEKRRIELIEANVEVLESQVQEQLKHMQLWTIADFDSMDQLEERSKDSMVAFRQMSSYWKENNLQPPSTPQKYRDTAEEIIKKIRQGLVQLIQLKNAAHQRKDELAELYSPPATSLKGFPAEEQLKPCIEYARQAKGTKFESDAERVLAKAWSGIYLMFYSDQLILLQRNIDMHQPTGHSEKEIIKFLTEIKTFQMRFGRGSEISFPFDLLSDIESKVTMELRYNAHP